MSVRVVWITGAGGFIGSHLLRAVPKLESGWRPVAWTRERLDLTDALTLERAFAADPPDAVIHAAALSRASLCQADPARAELLNVEVTRQLTDLAAEIPLLFLSTDVVFDGRKGGYVEADPIHPLSVYAETKARAEVHVLAHPRHAVVRLALTAGVSPTGDRSFSEELRRAWARGDTLTFFRDEFRSPLPASVAARAIWELLVGGHCGLFHLGGSERLSRWEIGQLLAQRWRIEPRLLREGSREAYTGPPRPADTSMCCARLQGLLSFPLPGLRQWAAENPAEPL
jgi:dTDP-4-dehydrorhamnose reductase